MSVVERTHLRTADKDRAECAILPDQRDGKRGAMSERERILPAERKFMVHALKIGHVNRFLVADRAPHDCVTIYWSGLSEYHPPKFAKLGGVVQLIVFDSKDVHNLGFADLRRVLGNRSQYRLDVAGRTGNHPQDFADCCLMLKRFCEIARLGLHFVEQACILDRDHSLVGEGLEQLDVIGGECAGLLAGDADQSNRRPVAPQRDEKQTAEAAQPRHFLQSGLFGPFDGGFKVRNLDDLAIADPIAPGNR